MNPEHNAGIKGQETTGSAHNPPYPQQAPYAQQSLYPQQPPAYQEATHNTGFAGGDTSASGYPEKSGPNPAVYSQQYPAPGQAGSYAPPPTQPAGYYQPIQQQPAGYGVAPGVPQTYIYVQPTPLADPPNDHFGYSLFVTICCCWLVGLFAIAKSMECRSAIRMGDRPLAVAKSAETRKLAHIALALGLVCIVIAVIAIILRIVLFF